MWRDLNFCPSEPPELLELHQFSISPTLRASFSFPQQKSTPLKRKRWNQKNHCQLNFGTSSSTLFFFAGSMFQLKVNWGLKWFGILESPPNDLWDWNPWVFFPLRIPEPPFAPNQQINQLGWFPTHQKSVKTHIRLPHVSKSWSGISTPKGLRWTLPVDPWVPGRVAFGRSLPSFGRPGSAREPKRDRLDGWMDGGRLAGFGGGGFFSTKNEVFYKSEDVERDLGTSIWLCVFHICDSFLLKWSSHFGVF